MSFLDTLKKKGKKKAVEDVMKRPEFKANYNLTVMDRIVKARIHLQRKSPFFSYLVMHLKFERNDILSSGSIGVDPDGYVYYHEGFMKRLNDEEIMSAICHEVSHIAFKTHERKKGRDHILFNISSDTWINNTLLHNGFQLIPGGVEPEDNEVSIWGIDIKDIDKKTTEDIYDELYNGLKKQLGKKCQGRYQSEDGKVISVDSGDYQIDEHIEERTKKVQGDSGKNKAEISKSAEGHGMKEGQNEQKSDSEQEQGKNEENQEEEKDWTKIVASAYAFSKSKGIIPAGIERQIDSLLHPQQNWEQILYKYITRELAVDSDWSFPSRRSQSAGVYLPHMKKENVEMAVWLDTSGSISEEQLKYFCGLLQNIVDSFANISMTVIACDSQIQGVFEIGHGKRDVLAEVKPKGGGGTDCNEVYKWLEDNKPSTRLVICVTDGEVFHKPKIEGLNASIIWLIPEDGGSEEMVKGTGEIIRFGL